MPNLIKTSTVSNGQSCHSSSNQLPRALEGEQLPILCSVTGQLAVILGFSTSPIIDLFLL